MRRQSSGKFQQLLAVTTEQKSFIFRRVNFYGIKYRWTPELARICRLKKA